MKTLAILIAVAFISGCATSGYSNPDFYTEFVDAKTLPSEQYELLKPGEEPRLVKTDDGDRDVKMLEAKGYRPIGQTLFNGVYETNQNAVDRAKKLGAVLVLIGSEYTNTETRSGALVMPNTQTSLNTGSVSAYGMNTGHVSGTYSGTTTTYGSTAVPYSVSKQRFDQQAMYFVKLKNIDKMRFGVNVSELSPEHRTQIGRNTGALLGIVFEGTPAYYANVMSGDILLAIDAEVVRDAQHALKLIGSYPETNKFALFTVFRNGKEQDIEITFKQ